MSWKDLPYWLKGGIIGIVVLLSIILIDFLFLDSNILILLMFYNYWIASIINYCTGGESCLGFWAFALFPAYITEAFFIGLLIGWIIGKIRGKN